MSYVSETLIAESIYIIREVYAHYKNPVFLYSLGKDSTVLLDLIRKAFHPHPIPFRAMHIDTRWKFKEMIDFRDQQKDLSLIVYTNPIENVTPFNRDDYTDIMKTQALRQAMEKYGFDAAIGGARRDEEISRAKERIFSVRRNLHYWDPKIQRPELWMHYNPLLNKDETMRIFPLSNWTEKDIWYYIRQESLPIVPLYFAKERPVVRRKGMLIMVDDDRIPVEPGEIEYKSVRFRTLGCYPLTGAVESTAQNLDEIIEELKLSRHSERQNRAIDHDQTASMERKKKEGYF